MDPVDQVSVSNYAVNKNTPIWKNDPNGDCTDCPKKFSNGTGRYAQPDTDMPAELKDFVFIDKRTKPVSDETVGMNLFQAAEKEIGRNDANREKVRQINAFVQSWVAIQATPLTMLGGVGLGVASGLSDFASQIYFSKGTFNQRLSDWNPVSTLSAFAFKNPAVSSIPGGIVDLSGDARGGKRDMYNSPLKLQTWKSIMLNTLGNMAGDHIGGLIRGGYGELGIKLSENGVGEIIGQQLGDVPSTAIDENTK